MPRPSAFYNSPYFLSFASGILLTLSFPGFHFGFLAWIALVPLFYGLEKLKTRSEVLAAGLTFGMTFFVLSLHWLTYVTAIGWLILALLETSFMLIFIFGAWKLRGIRNTFLKILGIALGWTAAEWIRTDFPVFGFGWNALGYSQAPYPWIRLAANAAGSYGIGFAIVFVNACIYEILFKPGKKKISKAALAGLPVLLALLLAHGLYHSRPDGDGRKVRISVIQGNIPQSVKWETVARDKIIEIYSKLTEIASYDDPDLIVWPEAAYPGYFNRDFDHVQIMELIKKLGVPALIGAPHLEGEDTAYNSAYLLDASGQIRGRYDKQYLVPFGEYVPLGPLLGWLKPIAYTLGVSDFSAGHTFKVFQSMNAEYSFSTLICYEDIFPHLARRFVNQGAEFLTVITNDAWFGPTAAGYQHEQASIFRAIENGVPVVRAANTGVSSFISAKGEVLARVQGRDGKETFITGKKTADITLGARPTLYRRGGWIFPYAATAAFVILLLFQQRSSCSGTVRPAERMPD